MYKAADGKSFGNTEQGRHYDQTRKKKHTESEAGKPVDTAESEHEEKPIEDSIAEHGPVEHIEMHSHHRDGHVHKSTHHDGASAHEHIDKAMPPQEHAEQPALDQSMGSAPGIPGMAA